MFSKSCEYGIRASIYIAKQSLKDRKVSQKEIAKSIDSPEAFTAKILQKLSKTNVIRSMKGPNGGFFVDGSDLERVSFGTSFSRLMAIVCWKIAAWDCRNAMLRNLVRCTINLSAFAQKSVKLSRKRRFVHWQKTSLSEALI